MARVFMTGFENGLSDDLYSFTGTISTTQKRTGAYSMYFADRTKMGYISLPAAVTQIYMRVGVYCTGLNQNYGFSGALPYFYFLDSASNVHVALYRNISTGATELKMGLDHRVGAMASGTALSLNAWDCVEIYYKIDDTVGRFTVKVNNNTIIDYTGDTRNAGTADIKFILWNKTNYASEEGIATGYYDDIAINDVSGAVNNTWIGQGGIRLAFVDGAGANTGLTPSTGTNWSCVDEIPSSDTDYVHTITVDAYDLYTLDTSSMPANGVVSAVRWLAKAKLDAGTASITPVIRSESTTEQQTDIGLSSSYSAKSLIMELDPIDNAAWTLAKVNALEIGAAKG